METHSGIWSVCCRQWRRGHVSRGKCPLARSSLCGRRRCYLVHDHEGCLWAEENLEALDGAGFDVVTNHPKYYPVWRNDNLAHDGRYL